MQRCRLGRDPAYELVGVESKELFMIEGSLGGLIAGIFGEKERIKSGLIGVAIAMGACLLLSLAAWLVGFDDILDGWNKPILLAEVLSLSLLSSIVLDDRRKERLVRLTEDARMLERNKRLHQLTADEKVILKGYINGDARTQNFDLRNGTVLMLVRDGILVKTAQEGFIHCWGFSIEPWVVLYLNDHPNLLL